MSNHIDMMKRQTRNHPALVYEDENLHSSFTDLNRLALEGNTGKVGAPLSKRRNGSGPTDGSTPGLFGNVSLTNFENSFRKHATPTNILLGLTIAGAVVYYYK